MKKRILTSLATIALASTLVGGATFAYFNATASNDNNLFKSGTIRLGSLVDLSDKGNIKPGDTGIDQFTLANEDANGLSTLDSDVKATVAIDPAAAELAAWVKATVTVDGIPVSLSAFDANSNGVVTYAELNGAAIDLGSFTGGVAQSKDLQFAWEFIETGAPQNNLQGKTFNAALSFEARQK